MVRRLRAPVGLQPAVAELAEQLGQEEQLALVGLQAVVLERRVRAAPVPVQPVVRAVALAAQAVVLAAGQAAPAALVASAGKPEAKRAALVAI